MEEGVGDGTNNMEVENEPESWEVKQVLDIRYNKQQNRVEYQLEWCNWEGDPTWEPEENCECPDLLDKFRQTAKFKTKWKAIKKLVDRNQENREEFDQIHDIDTLAPIIVSSQKNNDSSEKNGFERGAKLLKILAADMDKSNYLSFICKFDDRPHSSEPISKAILQANEPRATLRFLEKRLTLDTSGC